MRAEADSSKALGSYVRVGILVFLLVLITARRSPRAPRRRRRSPP